MKESQQILKPKGKIVVIADYREKEVIEHLKNFGLKVNETNLDFCDFLCSEKVAIERKTHSDFLPLNIPNVIATNVNIFFFLYGHFYHF